MSWSSSSPPMRMLRLTTIPPRLITATSVVPPPMSTMRLPVGSPTGRPAPIAAAMGSSISRAQRAPELSAASRTALFSTSVTPDGMPTSIRGRGIRPTRSCTLCTKYLSICSVTSKSLITPSLRGRTAMMLAGVRPSIRFASAPMASTRLVRWSIATTDGSLMTMPRSRTWTRVLAVPRSMPMSRENSPRKASSMKRIVPWSWSYQGPRPVAAGRRDRSVRSVYRARSGHPRVADQPAGLIGPLLTTRATRALTAGNRTLQLRASRLTVQFLAGFADSAHHLSNIDQLIPHQRPQWSGRRRSCSSGEHSVAPVPTGSAGPAGLSGGRRRRRDRAG